MNLTIQSNMPSLEVYIRERAEELRSRVALMNSTLISLKQNFWTTYCYYLRKQTCPPFLFPVSTFRRLENRLTEISTEIERMEPDGRINYLIIRLNLLHRASRDLLQEIVRLQNVLNQRMSGLGLMKLLEFQKFTQIEFGTISKSYCAVDALTVDLVRKTLGSNWIKNEKYIPISLFDYRGYMINTYSYIISIPYYDSFRSRFWASLSHEVAHMLVTSYADRPGTFRNTMKDARRQLMELYDYSEQELGGGAESTGIQVAELTSDIISVYVCPPAFLTAAMIIKIPSELRPNALIDRLRFSTHPPTDARIEAMKTVLERTQIISNNEDIQKVVDSVSSFFLRKNMSMLSNQSRSLIIRLNDFARRYVQKILRILPQIGVCPFTVEDLNSTKEAFYDFKNNDLSPIQLITFAWIKRLKVIKGDGQLYLRDYFRLRKIEPKLFDQIVDLLYKYYEEQIIPNTRGVDSYDLCLDFN